MQRSIVFIILCLCSAYSYSQSTSLTVKISNIDINKAGTIMVLLFNDNGFPIEHQLAFASKKQAADSPNLKLTFELPQQVSELAIKVLHDEDNSNTVTKNWTGIIPAEGLGFSNNQTIGTFGPPSYKDCRISLTPTQNAITHSIEIVYP